MRAGQLQLPERRAVGAQLVGYQQFRHKPLLSESLPISRNAARLLRRLWTSISRTSPSWSTARQRYIRLPAIRTTISSRCHPISSAGFSSCCHRSRVPSSQRIFHYVVAPSGSCVHRVRDNFDAIEQTAAARHPGVTGHRGRRSLGVVLSDITLTSRLSRATGQFPAASEPACCKRIEKADRRPPRYWAIQKIEPGSRNRPVPRRGGDRRRHTYPTSR